MLIIYSTIDIPLQSTLFSFINPITQKRKLNLGRGSARVIGVYELNERKVFNITTETENFILKILYMVIFYEKWQRQILSFKGIKFKKAISSKPKNQTNIER